MTTLTTAHLRLVAATAELTALEMQDHAAFGDALAAEIPANWPPELLADALPYFLGRLTADPALSGWLTWYGIRQPDDQNDDTSPVLVASGGYYGPPNSGGTVEIGYSVLPQYQRHGYATEMMQALVARAFTHPTVRRIVAETTPDNHASQRILAKLGLTPIGAGRDEGSLRFARKSPTSAV